MPSRRPQEEQLRSLTKERDELRRNLGRLSLLFRTLLQSRRWRVGNALGDVLSGVRRGPAGPNPIAEINTILRPYRGGRRASGKARAAGRGDQDELARWLSEMCRQVPKVLASRRWRLGRALLRPARALGFGDINSIQSSVLATVRQGRKLLREANALDPQAQVLLHDLARDVPLLVASAEWRTGKRIAATVSRIRHRPQEDPAEQRIFVILAEYEAWRSSLAGVSAEGDREAFNRQYQEYLAKVEPELERQAAEGEAEAFGLRAIVVPGGSRPEPLPLAQRLAEVAAVTVCAPSGDDSTLIHLLNASLEDWPEDWLVVLHGSDALSPELPSALAAFVAQCEPEPGAVVFDHDHVEPTGRRVDPVFKPGFSPEWLIEHDYVGRAAAFRRQSLVALGGFEGPLRDIVRATLCKAFDHGEAVAKLDRVLLHVDADSKEAPRPGEDVEFAHRALERRGRLDRAQFRELAYGAEVRYTLPASALVSIVISFTDKVDLLRECVESIRRLTAHPRYELILVNTRSRETATHEYLEELREDPLVAVLELDESFNFSRANNLGAQAARGEYLVFLNNDTKLLTPDWLEQLCGYAALPETGAVGAKLLFPDGSLQHAGVVVGMGGFAQHLFAGQHEPFVPAPWIRHSRNVSSVTAACLAIERGKFLASGGFDERLVLTGSDVELCLRLMRKGLRNVLLPSVVLFHFERSSRRAIPVAEHNKRLSLFTYRDILRQGDPYFNTNLRLDTTELLPKTEPERPAVIPGQDSTLLAEPLEPPVRFLRLYDLSQQELAANRERIESFRARRRLVPETITWFLPHFDHVFRGGIHTILRIADHFSRRCGAANRLVFYGRERGDLQGMGRQIDSAFPALRQELILLRPGEPENDLPRSDIAFCTLWTSAYHLARYNRCRGKFYLVQDFEAGFNPENSVFALAEETYRLGFAGVANTPGVCEMYRGYGNEAEFFVPSVDRDIFSPTTLKLPDDVFRLVVYGRPDKARNAFSLAAESLRELKRRHGERVEILSVGADYDVRDYGLEGVLVNMGLLPDMHTVASVYRHSHAGLVFMLSKHPSYQPFEYMASGCAVVTNINEANLWFLRDRENALVVPPLRTPVVEGIEELMENPELRQRLVTGGLQTVAYTTWEEELDAVYRFVTTGEERACSPVEVGPVSHRRARA